MILTHDIKALCGEHFFDEEIKCDYKITKETKRMWAAQLDLYLEFARICDKYNLKYFIIYGGLLGAIRHNGFIPWDDDLDVGLMRDDYNKFLEIAPKELKEPYTLGCPYTCPNYLYSISTLRNGSGTFVSKIFKDLDFDKGIPIDIFPIDYCDRNTMLEDRKQIYQNIMECSVYMKHACGIDTPKQRNDIEKFGLVRNPLKSWENIQKVAGNPAYKNKAFCCVTSKVNNINAAPTIFPASVFENIVMHKFEGIDVPIPAEYDTYLKIEYGRYMELPPIEERGAINNQLIIMPDTPYKEVDFSKF